MDALLDKVYTTDVNDIFADEEIDMLFSQLNVITPPASLVQNIMDTVARLPLPQDESEESFPILTIF